MTVFFSTSDGEVNVKKVKVNDMHLIECNPRHISHKTGASTCPPLVYHPASIKLMFFQMLLRSPQETILM